MTTAMKMGDGVWEIMPESRDVRIKVDGVVHSMSSDFDSITSCGASLAMAGQTAAEAEAKFNTMLTLDAVSCLECIAGESEKEPRVYRCDCSWTGEDPDIVRGKAMCPACWNHDRKRVEVERA